MPHDLEDHVVVDLQQLRVRHVELERRDAGLDARGDRALGHALGERHVEPVVDARGLGPAPPRRQRVHRVLAAVRGDVVDDRRRAADRGGHGAGVEVVAHAHRCRRAGAGACARRRRRARAGGRRSRRSPRRAAGASAGPDRGDAPVGARRGGRRAARRRRRARSRRAAARLQLSRFTRRSRRTRCRRPPVRPNCAVMPVTVPESLDAALAALAADPDATVLAGGTDLMVEVNDGRRSLDARGRRRPGRRAARAYGSTATRS